MQTLRVNPKADQKVGSKLQNRTGKCESKLSKLTSKI
jgi:hypothetical protein